MKGNKNTQATAILVIICCLIVLMSLAFFWWKHQEEKEAYESISLTFKNIDKTYEVGTPLNAVEFIKATNAKEVDYPIIKNDSIGERALVYVAHDNKGYTREFVITITFVDSVKPILQLTTNEVFLDVGEPIDLKSYVKEAYDPVDGDLKVKIEKEKNYKEVGEHIIMYSIEDQHKNKVSAQLRLMVREKEVEEKKPVETQKDPQKPSNSTSNGDVPEVPKQSYAQEKEWLFIDGYTMPGGSNSAMDKCTEYMNTAGNRVGGCGPIFNTDGTFAGVRYSP